MKTLALCLIFITLSLEAASFTRCKIKDEMMYPDIFCFEEEGIKSGDFCARRGREIFNTHLERITIQRQLTKERSWEKDDPFWRECSAIFSKGECKLIYGKPCL